MELSMGNKPVKTTWVCATCNKEVPIKDIGAVLRDGKNIIPLGGECGGIVTKSDTVLCSKCSLQINARRMIKKATAEKRPLTINELLSCEEQLRANTYQEAYLKIKDRKNILDNSVRYGSLTFNEKGEVSVDFTCGKCSEETTLLISEASVKTPEQQLGFYMRMSEKVDMICPGCSHSFTLLK